MRRRREPRRGAITVLMAVAMVVLLGMVAFAVDIGYLCNARQQLQNAADSAALAGTAQLMNRGLLTGAVSPSTVMMAARSKAQQFATANEAGGVPVSLDTSSDVVCGYLADPDDHSSAFDPYAGTYNAVQITARRSTQRNQPLALFFGGLFGLNRVDLVAKATASFEVNIAGFKIGGSGAQTCKLLPFALDINIWNDATGGSGADSYSYNPRTRAVTAGGDGVHEVTLYPYKGNSPGNFGTVRIGVENNSTAILRDQIRYGVTREQLESIGGQIALGSDGRLLLYGNPGLSADIGSTLTEIIGQPRIICLFQPPVAAQGSKSVYTIVGFAGVIVTYSRLTGPDKAVVVQPEFVTDATAIGGGPAIPNSYVYSPLRLSR